MLFREQPKNVIPMSFLVPIEDTVVAELLDDWIVINQAEGFFDRIGKEWSSSSRTDRMPGARIVLYATALSGYCAKVRIALTRKPSASRSACHPTATAPPPTAPSCRSAPCPRSCTAIWC